MEGSKRFKLNRQDLTSVAKGAALAGAGGILSYLTVQAVPSMDLGDLAWLAPLLAVALNALRKFVADSS